MINIYVGSHNQHFCVHKALLCARRTYFDAMFNGGFEESQKRAASFPDDDPVAFSLFLEWLYTSRLPAMVDAVSEAQFLNRIRLYGFADRIGDAGLMETAMASILEGYKATSRCPSVRAVKLVYENTSPKDPLRFFMADVLYHIIGYRKDFSAEAIGVALGSSEDLAADLVELMRSGSPAETPAILISLHLPDYEE